MLRLETLITFATFHDTFHACAPCHFMLGSVSLGVEHCEAYYAVQELVTLMVLPMDGVSMC